MTAVIKVQKFKCFILVGLFIFIPLILTGCRSQEDAAQFEKPSQELIDFVNENNEEFLRQHEENDELVEVSISYEVGDGNELLIITTHHIEIDSEQVVRDFEDSWYGGEDVFSEGVNDLAQQLNVDELQVTFIIRDMNGSDIASRSFESQIN